MSWEKINNYLFDKYCIEGVDNEFVALCEEHDKEVRAQTINYSSPKTEENVFIEDTLREARYFAKSVQEYLFEIEKQRPLTNTEKKLWKKTHDVHIHTNDAGMMMQSLKEKEEICEMFHTPYGSRDKQYGGIITDLNTLPDNTLFYVENGLWWGYIQRDEDNVKRLYIGVDKKCPTEKFIRSMILNKTYDAAISNVSTLDKEKEQEEELELE